MIAAGRAPDVEGLGLEEAGIALTDDGHIEVDGAMRTSLAGVYAIGDLVHGPALAHKASDEGIIAAEDAAGLQTHPIEYIDVPRATFCYPNVGSFGLTEQQARDAGHDVVVGKCSFGAVGAGTVYGDRSGLVKIVGDKTTASCSAATSSARARPSSSRSSSTSARSRAASARSRAWCTATRRCRRRSWRPRATPMAGSSTADHAGVLLRPAQPRALPRGRAHPATLPVACEWIPVLAARAAGADALEGWRCERTARRARAFERAAARQRPAAAALAARFPFDSAFAMRAATYAKQIGRAVAFALAAFRQAFAGGRDLWVPDNVLIAAAACEMHPAAVLKGAELRSVATRCTGRRPRPRRAASARSPRSGARPACSPATRGCQPRPPRLARRSASMRLRRNGPSVCE